MAFFRAAFLACPVLMLAAGPARAQGGWSPSLLVKGGTLGFGPELDVRVPATRFGVRADIDGLGFGVADCSTGESRTASAPMPTTRGCATAARCGCSTAG